MIEIQVRHDRERGCGWRKPGGKYLIGGELSAPCGKLPHFLDVCPACGHGIKPMRGWRWIGARALFGVGICEQDGDDRECVGCVLADPPDRAGLIWIGDTFYATPGAFVAEAGRLGISRRIACVPKGFQVGETLVLLASRKVPAYGTDGALFRDLPLKYKPGIFAAFIPTALEYVVKGNESQEELERLSGQGFTPVRIERVTEESGGDGERREVARPGSDAPGPPGLRPPGHGTEEGEPPGGDYAGWIV